jgi:DNA-binding MarR family transcriptional regulator
MSRDILPGDRAALLAELGDAVRSSQRATDVVDDLAVQLLGVNRTDSRCLDILDQRGRMSAGELAREASLTSGAITAVIDRLGNAGYVQRVSDPSDRRRVLVELTPKAREASWELFGPLAEQGEQLLAPYSEEQLRLLIDFHRLGIEVQERHAEFLRERLRSGERRPA